MKALFQIVLGCVLIASGIALEGLWLAFCFGTVVIGLVLLIWFTPILFFPFTLLSISGWNMLKNGVNDIVPLNLSQISAAISPIVSPQINEIELAGNRVPLDARVLVYIAALAFVVSRRSLSLKNVIDITSMLYTGPTYKSGVDNLKYDVDYSNGMRGFWEAVNGLAAIARDDLVSGRGSVLLQLAEDDRKKAEGWAKTALVASV